MLVLVSRNLTVSREIFARTVGLSLHCSNGYRGGSDLGFVDLGFFRSSKTAAMCERFFFFWSVFLSSKLVTKN